MRPGSLRDRLVKKSTQSFPAFPHLPAMKIHVDDHGEHQWFNEWRRKWKTKIWWKNTSDLYHQQLFRRHKGANLITKGACWWYSLCSSLKLLINENQILIIFVNIFLSDTELSNKSEVKSWRKNVNYRSLVLKILSSTTTKKKRRRRRNRRKWRKNYWLQHCAVGTELSTWADRDLFFGREALFVYYYYSWLLQQ